MKNLLKIPKKHMHFYLLSVVMILFIVFPVEVPSELGGLFNVYIFLLKKLIFF